MPKDWDQIRSLHIAESEVEAAIAAALGDGPVGRLVDIGTGTGRMIELFGGARRPRAIGIDRSPEMLRLARVKLAEAGLAAPSCARATCTRCRCPTAAPTRDHPPGAALCAAARRRDRRGGAAAGARAGGC
jgi:precorrin-6B methylase 2